MIIQAVISTTHVDRQGMKMSKEAIISMAEQMKRNIAIPITLEHDVSFPPLGKVIDGWVEHRDDGEYQVVAVQEYFDRPVGIWLGDGSRVFVLSSASDVRPFVNSIGRRERAGIGFDQGLFQSQTKLNEFLNDAEKDIGYGLYAMGRKSWLPDPILIVSVGTGIASLLCGKIIYKTIEKVSDEISTDIANLYSSLRAASASLIKHLLIPSTRPITYVLTASIDSDIEFVARTTDVDMFLNSIINDDIWVLANKAKELKDTLGATRVQFLMNEAGGWEFNYLLTESGKVIGTPLSFSRRARKLELMNSSVASHSNDQGRDSGND